MNYRPFPSSARRLRSEDLFRIAIIPEARISPDGSRVCFVKKVFLPEENRYQSHLWMVSTSREDLEPLQFTSGDYLDHSPAWSPDGRWIAFLSNRSRTDQLWIAPSDGGKERQITSIKGVSGRPV